MKRIHIVLLASVLLASPSFAKGHKVAGHYGMGGCGLGSLIIQDPGKWPQLGSSIVNSVADYYVLGGYFAISSGTSNCDTKAKDEALDEQKVYVTYNLNAISREAAQGGGEHLTALAEVFGCDAAKLSRLSQTQRSTLFNGNADEVYQNYVKAIRSDEELSKSCDLVG